MSLTAGRHWPAQGVKLTGLTKKSVFRAENGIFFKSSFYTKMICDPKYNFSLGQKYLVVASFKVCIFHQIQPKYGEILHDQHNQCWVLYDLIEQDQDQDRSL